MLPFGGCRPRSPLGASFGRSAQRCACRCAATVGPPALQHAAVSALGGAWLLSMRAADGRALATSCLKVRVSLTLCGDRRAPNTAERLGACRALSRPALSRPAEAEACFSRRIFELNRRLCLVGLLSCGTSANAKRTSRPTTWFDMFKSGYSRATFGIRSRKAATTRSLNTDPLGLKLRW